MTKKTIFCALLMMSALSASAQRLSIEDKTVDCGNVLYDTPVTVEFKMRNRGLRKLVIQDIRPACGCTKIEYPKEPIAVGERFTVRAIYDARQLGHFNKQIGILTNADKKPVYVTLKGVVLSQINNFEGTYPYEMGDLRIDKNNIEYDDVNRGDRPEQVIHVVNNGTKMLTPNIMHLPSYLTAQVIPEHLSPKQRGKIILTLNSANVRDLGLTQTNVYLGEFYGDKVEESNEISVSTVLLPGFTNMTAAQKQYAPKMTLSAEQLDLGEFGTKSKKKGEITIKNNGRSALKITSMQMFTKGISVVLTKSELGPGETATLKITAYRDDLKSARSKPRILMITNDPDKSKTIITVNVK